MEVKAPKKTVYNLVGAVILVLAISMISVFTFLTNRDSEELSKVVSQLSENKYEIDKIDHIIQLLYRAENDSRLYVLTRDENLQTSYLNLLNRVSDLIVTLQKEDEMKIDGLIEDKKLKTRLFVNARILADSLLLDYERITNIAPNQTPVIEKTALLQSEEVDPPQEEGTTKIVEEFVTQKKSKKGLFGRIKDAIVNKPQIDERKSVVTIESESNKPPVVQELKIEQSHSVPPTAPGFTNISTVVNLSEKEKSLLIANGLLFEELKGLLDALKENERALQFRRRAELGSDAASLMSNLKVSNKYHLILSLILTALTLNILGLLYKNMRALNKAKQKAEQYANYKSDFIATLSHEIRTPLHSIHAFTDELLRKDSDTEEKEVLDAIKLSSNMLLSIANNILDYTKMERGKFKLNHLPFYPSSIIQEVIMGLTIQAKRKGLTIHSDLEASLDRKIYGDAFQFRQLLINLLINAIKYTETGSVRIESSLHLSDEYSGVLNISVIDTGVGIPKERLPFIFEEYTVEESKVEIKEGSTGLGLNIIKKIIDYHNGEIKVKSEQGKGTAFHLKIPYDLYLEKETLIQEKELEEKKQHILIVENDPLNSRILKMLFGDSPYLVTYAQDGLEAFAKFKEDAFDVVITDISMPGMSGVELAREIRNLESSEKSSVPIIAITGFQVNQALDEADSGLIDEWMVKPFDIDLLLEKVKEVCTAKV